jgi:hypothetical protein
MPLPVEHKRRINRFTIDRLSVNTSYALHDQQLNALLNSASLLKYCSVQIQRLPILPKMEPHPT